LLAFTLVYTLTGGGPGTATTVLSWLAYQTTFQQLRLGEGAAMFYMLLFAMIGLAAVYIRLLHRPQRG
jgi:ABC-type sugar transport system permease subunit